MADEITRKGNPAKPQGEEGKMMLDRMNDSHYEVTGWALDFFDYLGNETVLDIGCGGGRTLHRLSKRVPNGTLKGIDYSSVSVEKSIAYNQEDISSGKMEVLEASVEHLPFLEGTFDKVITVESFYFWPSPIDNLKEVRRVLKQNGKFLLVADIYGRDDLPQSVLDNINQFNMNNPSETEFAQLFVEAGFTEVVVHLKEGTTWICVEGRK